MTSALIVHSMEQSKLVEPMEESQAHRDREKSNGDDSDKESVCDGYS